MSCLFLCIWCRMSICLLLLSVFFFPVFKRSYPRFHLNVSTLVLYYLLVEQGNLSECLDGVLGFVSSIHQIPTASVNIDSIPAVSVNRYSDIYLHPSSYGFDSYSGTVDRKNWIRIRRADGLFYIFFYDEVCFFFFPISLSLSCFFSFFFSFFFFNFCLCLSYFDVHILSLIPWKSSIWICCMIPTSTFWKKILSFLSLEILLEFLKRLDRWFGCECETCDQFRNFCSHT